MNNDIFLYKKRLHFIDNVLNTFSREKQTKFYILATLHYIPFFLVYYVIFFSNNFKLFSIIYIVVIFQIIVNIIDDGCILMKLERKYVGKQWFGPYTIFKLINDNFITENNVYYIFRNLSIFVILYGIYRLIFDFGILDNDIPNDIL